MKSCERREIAQSSMEKHLVSIKNACEWFHVSETCYRFQPKLSFKNDLITDWLIYLTSEQSDWGFGLCFDYLRNVKGYRWNHKRVYRIYCELALNLRIKPRRRLKRNKPEPFSWVSKHIFDSLEDAQDYATNWLWFYNHERPHKANGGRPPLMVA